VNTEERGAAILDKQAGGLRPLAIPFQWAGNIAGTKRTGGIVQGIVARGDLGVIYGESGCGKTYLALDMAGSIGAGIPWLGRKTKRGAVLYVAAEAGASIADRVVAWREAHLDAEDVLLAVITAPVNLRAGLDVDRIIETAQAIRDDCGVDVVLVVIDTLSRAFGGGNENDSADMGALVANSDLIRHQTGAAVLWVHHAGKDVAKGARGHSLLRAATDVEIEVTNRDGTVIARVTKLRDGAAGAELAATLRPVAVGVDDFGDSATVCIVEPAGSLPATPKPAKRGSRRDIALESLREALAEHGEPGPGTSTVPKGVKVVRIEQWKARWTLRTGYDEESESAGVNFDKDRKALVDAGAIGISKPFVWSTTD